MVLKKSTSLLGDLLKYKLRPIILQIIASLGNTAAQGAWLLQLQDGSRGVHAWAHLRPNEKSESTLV